MSERDEPLEIRCPTCHKSLRVPKDWAPRPFCSARCQLIDLGRWLDEDFKLSRPAGQDDVDA